jgi:hypothetical protein
VRGIRHKNNLLYRFMGLPVTSITQPSQESRLQRNAGQSPMQDGRNRREQAFPEDGHRLKSLKFQSTDQQGILVRQFSTRLQIFRRV